MSTKDTDTFITIPDRYASFNEDVIVSTTVHNEDEPWMFQVKVTGEGVIFDIIDPSTGEVIFTRGQTFQEIADDMVEVGL